MKSYIKVRKAKLEDIDDLVEFESRNQSWFAHFFPSKALESTNRAYFHKQISVPLPQTQHYLVCLNDKTIIGRFCAQYLNETQTVLEISYRFEKGYTRRGIAQYALRHLLLIFACYGVTEVYANVSSHNHASKSLLIRCGFTHHETDIQSVKLSSGVEDNLIYRWVNQSI